MRIGTHGLRDHLRLLAPMFGLIAAVWALRWIMALASTPAGLVRMMSVSVAGAVAVLVAVVMIHFKQFGGYLTVVVSALLLVLWEELLIVAAILCTMVTGIENVYSVPEYSLGGGHLTHIAGHLSLGLGFEGIFAGVMGCALLWVLRRLVPIKDLTKSGRHIILRDSGSFKKWEE